MSMKKIYFLVLIAFVFFQQTDAQLLKKAKNLLNNNGKGLTEKDAADGIREALINGTGESVKVVSVLNGYWGNAEIKIPFPPDAVEMESKLRAVGLGKKVDEFDES